MAMEIQDELRTIDLGDERLNKRSRKVLGTIFADPVASINSACQGWAETQGAYRFFDNDKTRPEKILAPHQEATRARMAEHPVVLIAQDTTELDFGDHPPSGAGPLNSEKQRGFMDHTHLALTPAGLCLGVVDADIWARSDEGFGESKQRQHDPLETKEKYRWLTGYRRACALAEETPETQVIGVADSEADIYELLMEAEQVGKERADYLIRSGKKRSLPELDPEAGPYSHRKLQQEMEQAPLLVVRELKLPRTPNREAREARLEIRAQRVRLKPPYRKAHTKLSEIEVNGVLVQEVNPPSDEEPIEWLLITSLPILAAEDVLQVVDYYRARWQIEVFFRIFKTGCQVERIQLETSSRLLPCLMLYKIIAWRVLYLTMLGRECPELPCDVLFPEDEWKPVWKVVTDEPIPEQAPRLSLFLLMLAQLGGHNGRRRDHALGPQALWIGIRRMTDFAVAWKAFGPNQQEPPASREPT